MNDMIYGNHDSVLVPRLIEAAKIVPKMRQSLLGRQQQF
jgi:hypothetical protein